jgi:multidrug efflux system outer membrane protein
MKRVVVALAAILLAGCAVGPKYSRPKVTLPDQFRGAGPEATGAASIADTKWQDLFTDSALRQLVETALEQNYDLQIAAERVQQARAQLDIRRASLFPFFNNQTQWNASRGSSLGSLPFIAEGTNLSYAYSQVGVGATWELDFWGRLRKLTESARAQYLAAAENQQAVRISLIAEVMNTYFLLLEQDRELAISKQTRDIAENGLRLTTLRRDRGAATGLDVRQAEQLLYTATAQIAAAARNIAQQRMRWVFCSGRPPPISRAEASSNKSSGPQNCLPVYLRPCSRAGRISAGPSSSSFPPMRRSARREPSTFRRSP